jgi:glucosamine--fructose-6-phosphate aminotransferase (isomerizing)
LKIIKLYYSNLTKNIILKKIMCGIVGYIGKKECLPILLNGLRRMEYRGYDSAGVAILNDNIGKVNDLANVVKDKVLTGNIGIGHTRWATHGEPNFVNSHPHSDSKEEIALIHNGIIENYASIKKSLISEGYTFRSDTDTEVLVQFVRSLYDKIGDLETAFRSALKQVVGAYGIAMISSLEPDKLYIARNGSPLALGIGDNVYCCK